MSSGRFTRTDQRAKAQTFDWLAIERSPEFKELVATRRRILAPLTVIWLVVSIGYLLLAAFVPTVMAWQVADGLPFASYVRETGFAVPLVCLAFGAFWLLPLVTALVAGDIVANEDHNGTLKTILTRSVERWHVLVGKVLAALTYTVALLVAYVGIALVAGGLMWGFDPLTTLSGTTIGPGRALLLTGAGTLAYLLPLSAIAAIGILLSTITRNSAAAVVGTLMVSIFVQIIGSISALDALDPYLLSTQFNAWQGILREPTDWAPIVRSAWVCALYALPALGWALTVFLRRDVTGG